MRGMEEPIPGRNEALCRAHEMRAMREEGMALELIAAYFDYHATSVQKMVDWHTGLYPVMPPISETETPSYFLPLDAPWPPPDY